MKVIISFLSLFLVFENGYCAYSDNIARTKLLPMAAAAYYNNKSIDACVTNSFKSAKILGKYKSGFLFNTHTAISVVSNDDKAIIVAFGGDSTFTDVVLVDPKEYYGNKTTFIGGGQVSSYIYNNWKSLWDAGIQDDLLSAKNTYAGYQLWVTGHNIGGAFASITSAYVLKLGFYTSSQVSLYTFGQPRVGDNAFATAHDQLLGGSSYRVTHRQDPIPHVPKETDDGYYHHENEIFYNNDMTVGDGYAECDADESSSCSDGNLVDLSLDDHRHYFNVAVTQFGAAGCKS